GWRIARLHLAEAVACDDVEAGFEIDDPWFVITPQEAVRYLDDGMWLVDAGDYDNDGKSELLFSINRYDRGGYELFYDDFKRHATFEFSYHQPPNGQKRRLLSSDTVTSVAISSAPCPYNVRSLSEVARQERAG
ncbi:MAG: hypothetical protein OEV76_07145, partial [Anaerolineae bacterium]|nr:hypothetical protein [Anaerolineae bacterium]